MRPGCDRPAAARLAFDPVGLQLWLDPLGNRSAPVQELCDFHIERLTIPRGWSATDRRPGPAVGEIELPGAVIPEPVVTAPVVEVDVPPPTRPRTTPATRPAVAAGAESSLLSRAFAWTGPQQSILTQGRNKGNGSDPTEPDPTT